MGEKIQAVFTNMCMVSDGGCVLVQNRVDPDWPGICFPGGHVEDGESIVESVIRELREETGLTVEEPRLCGIKEWQREDGSRYVVFLFRTNRFHGTLASSEEGEVFWLPREELLNCRLAQGFEEMVKIFEDDSLSELYYYKEEGERRMKLF